MSKSQQTTLQKKNLSNLDSVLAKLNPSLTPAQIRDVKLKITNYIASGLNEGYDIALIKSIGNEINIKVLKIKEEN